MDKKIDFYQIPDVIRSELDLIAGERSLKTSELINEILENYLKLYSAEDSVHSDRRSFPRKPIESQAVIQLNMSPRSFNYRSVLVKNISMGGILIEFANEHAFDRHSVNENSTVEIIFNFTQEGKPISFVCRPCHIQKSNDHLLMGLSFVDGSFKEYKELAYQLRQ